MFFSCSRCYLLHFLAQKDNLGSPDLFILLCSVFTMNAMVLLTKEQVPSYLVHSDFYTSLSSDDENDFQIPEMYFKSTPTLASIPSDLSHLLHTSKFWGLHVLPPELIAFLLEKPASVDVLNQVCTVLEEFDADYNLLEMYKALSVCDNKHSARLEALSLCGRADILEYFVGFNKKASISMVKQAAEHGLFELLQRSATALRDRKNPFSQVCLKKVAGNGHIECLRFLLEQGCVPDRGVSLAAAENGHLGCLQLANEHHREFDSKAVNAAALHGHLPCLTYLLEQGCPLDRTSAYNAALHGHLECMSLLIDHDALLTKRMCNAAAMNGHLSCLQLLFERGCPWDKECARLAVTHNHFDCLQFAVDNGCRCDCSVADAAASGGHVQCLEYLLSSHKPASYMAVEHACLHGHVDCVKALFDARVTTPFEGCAILDALRQDNVAYLHTFVAGGFSLPRCVAEEAARQGSAKCLNFICSVLHHPLTADSAVAAARNGQLECLSILHEHGCPWHGGVYTTAAAKGHLECLQYAVEHHCPRGTEDVCATAAANEQLESLQYLHAHGFPLTLQTCRKAIGALSLKCLGFAIEHGAPLDAILCADAITENKHSITRAMEFLRYLREAARCPWDGRTSAAAAECDLSVLQYVHEQGCPWDERTPSAAVRAANGFNCLEYTVSRGCPCVEDICTEVAMFSSLEALKLVHQHGYEWNARTAEAAAESGDLIMLEHLHVEGCPWDEGTPAAAAAGCHLSVLEFVYENGCPWDIRTTFAAAEAGNYYCLEFAYENGCPWDETVSEAAAKDGDFEDNDCFAFCYDNNCPMYRSTYRKYNVYNARVQREDTCCVQ